MMAQQTFEIFHQRGALLTHHGFPSEDFPLYKDLKLLLKCIIWFLKILLGSKL